MADQKTIGQIAADIPAPIKQAVRDLHWMARRYADGRCSYAPGMFNGQVRYLMAAGFEFGEPLFARDGMGRAFDGLTEDEVSAAEKGGMQLHAELNTSEFEDRINAIWDQAVEACIDKLKKRRWTLDSFDDAKDPTTKAIVALTMERDREALRTLKRNTENDNG